MKNCFPGPQDTSWLQYLVYLGESCIRIGNVHNNCVVMNSVEVIVRKRKIKGIGNLEQSVGQSGFLGYRSCNVNLRLLHIYALKLAEGDGCSQTNRYSLGRS